MKVKTRVVKAGDAAAKGPDVILDGPFVTYTKSNKKGSFSFSNSGRIRAYDVSGRRLRKDGPSSSTWKNNITHKTIAFRGNVVQFQMDTAEQWAKIEFSYALPPHFTTAVEPRRQALIKIGSTIGNARWPCAQKSNLRELNGHG